MQISKHLRRERILRKISQRAGIETVNNSLPSAGGTTSNLTPDIIGQPSLQFEQSNPLP